MATIHSEPVTRVRIVAEAGVNHNGDVETACRLAEAAQRAGADAVKFQTYRTDRLVSSHAPFAAYQRRGAGLADSQATMLRQLELSEADFRRVARACADLGITFLSTPFDVDSLRFLVDELGVLEIKIASGDLTDAPLLFEAARRDCAVILSTGMATLDEVAASLAVLASGYLHDGRPPASAFALASLSPESTEVIRRRVTLLHCTSQYPASVAESNLRAMDTLRSSFGCAVGLSDHTPGIVVSVAAAARGAVLIEKHVTLDRSLPGPDHRASLEPTEFAALVAAIREVEAALGSGVKAAQPSELDTRAVARRSLAAIAAIAADEEFTEANLGTLRPGTGMSPMHYWEILGQRASRPYSPGDLITE